MMFHYGMYSMSKQNRRSQNLFPDKHNIAHLNRILLSSLAVCVLFTLLVTSATAKEFHINLKESLDMNNNDKKPKDIAQKTKPQTKQEKKEIKKTEKPTVNPKPIKTEKKPVPKIKKTPAKPPLDKTKNNSAKLLIR